MRLAAGVAALLLWPASGHAQDVVADTGYSRSFECPESLWTRWGRDRADMRFTTWAQSTHPDWSIEEMVAYRMDLLESHGCQETLAAIRAGTIQQQVEAEAANERRAAIVVLGGGAMVLGVALHRRREKRRQLG